MQLSVSIVFCCRSRPLKLTRAEYGLFHLFTFQTQTLVFSRSCHAYKHTHTFTLLDLICTPCMTDVRIHTIALTAVEFRSCQR